MFASAIATVVGVVAVAVAAVAVVDVAVAVAVVVVVAVVIVGQFYVLIQEGAEVVILIYLSVVLALQMNFNFAAKTFRQSHIN